jgi:hypothetical protein
MLRLVFCLFALIFAISFTTFTSVSALATTGIKGDWDATFTIANQTVEGTITLDVNGKNLSGTIFTVHTGQGTITDGTYENNKLNCTLKFEKHESIALTGEYKDDKLSGTFATEGMTGTWTAVRKR